MDAAVTAWWGKKQATTRCSASGCNQGMALDKNSVFPHCCVWIYIASWHLWAFLESVKICIIVSVASSTTACQDVW